MTNFCVTLNRLILLLHSFSISSPRQRGISQQASKKFTTYNFQGLIKRSQTQTPSTLLALILFFTVTTRTFAWVYPEHRQIAILAIQSLRMEDRSLLNQLWRKARMGNEARLTEFVIDTTKGIHPLKLDYAAWAAIAGDHSCSPENMLYNILQTEWIMKVADIAAQLQINLANAKTNSQRINSLRNSDIRLQRVDIEYATRAGSNNVHFLLSRPEPNTDASQYIKFCLAEGSPLNAVGAYACLHMSALSKALKYSNEMLAPEEKSALALAALADEAFALHFLEDIYASGHIAGTWGNASLRKGTHDTYNERGLEITCWDGTRAIMMGDSYMRNEDAKFASLAVRMSLEQLIDAAIGKLSLPYTDALAALKNQPDSFNVCKNIVMPRREYDSRLLSEILVKTPIPGLATGLGELPRFRAELGTFLGISTSLDASTLFGGFGKQQKKAGGQGGLEANIRFGLGLEGVLNQAGDGLVFLQFGWRQDGASTSKFANKDPSISVNSISSAVPGRSAYSLRLRLPFWLIPGDLLIAGPILLAVSPKTLQNIAVTAANGGLIPWQSGIATGIGRFQFILGREIGVSLYGKKMPVDVILVPTPDDKTVLLEYRSTRLDFPFLEYSAFRHFSQDQSSSLIVQLNTGVDIPHHIAVKLPVGAPAPELKNLWYLGIRILFDWRHYF